MSFRRLRRQQEDEQNPFPCVGFQRLCNYVFSVNGFNMSGVLLTAFRCQLNLSQVPRAGQATCFGVHSSEEHFPIADDIKCLLPQQTGTGIHSSTLEGPMGEAAGQQGKSSCGKAWALPGTR